MSVRFQDIDQTHTNPRRPTPTSSGRSIPIDVPADRTTNLAVSTFMSDVSRAEMVIAEAHADCLRNMHEGQSHDRVRTRMQRLNEVLQDLQDEYLVLTNSLSRPPAILEEAPGRLGRSRGVLNSVCVLIHKPQGGQQF